MPIPVTCPGCSARMNAPDAAAGKKVKCPKCQKVLAVPELVVDAPAFEVVEDEPTQPVKKPAPRPVAKPQVKADVVVDEDDEDEVRPAKKRARAVVEDDEDDRPRKKKKKSAAGGSSMARNIVGGVVLIVLLGVVAFVFWDKFGKKEEVASNTPPAGDPPAGPQRPGPQGPGPVMPKGPGPQLPEPNNPGPNPPSGGEKLKLQAARVDSPQWTTDGELILAPYITRERRQAFGVWDVRTSDPLVLIEDKKSLFFPDAVGISPNRKQVAIVSKEAKSLTLWNVASGVLEKTIKLSPETKSGGVPAFATYTPNGKAIVAAYEGTLLRVDLETGMEKVLLKDIEIHDISYCPEKNLAVYNALLPNAVGELRVADLSRPEASLVLPLKEDERLRRRPDISADGKTVVAYIEDRTTPLKPKWLVHVYDVVSKQLKAQVPLPIESEDPSFLPLSVSADGNRVVCGYSVLMSGMSVGKCWSYDVSSKTLRQVGPDYKQHFTLMPILGNGSTVGVWRNGALELYNAETGKIATP
ncbi:hypothetical protein J8F10_20895 [Gemmata sp. G18]|uniref:Serine/threonine protein kinase n=1 Tax=Gemmata palustris TaxID=2822762 RepID=A0ABS5BVM0_9BACT|nr:hypothetical protein [Gemmata palustris]MBP3957716.1 hypothetical protein [Gemmata palustris]